MSRQTRRIAALLTATALAGGGIGMAQAASTTSAKGAARTSAPERRGPASSATLAKIADTLGVSSADLKAALDANRPARPAGDRPGGGPQQFAGDLATALGVSTSDVTTILDANRPAKPAGPPAKGSRPDQSKLIAALADGLKLDTAKVTAALDSLDANHRADETARHTAMYAAVAKTLGLSTDAVQAAFEANMPAPPAH